MCSLSCTFGMATTPSGSTVTNTYMPPWAVSIVTEGSHILEGISHNAKVQWRNRTWSFWSSFSLLKISFSVFSNLLFPFSGNSKSPLLSCMEKLAGICSNVNTHQYKVKQVHYGTGERHKQTNSMKSWETHTEAGYDIFTSYQVLGLIPSSR